MKIARLLIVMALIAALCLGSAFAKTENSHFVIGDLTNPSDQDAEIIALDFLQHKMTQGDFRVKTKHKDNLNGETIRVDQYYNNVRVLGSDLVLNVDKNGVLKSVVGNMVDLDGKLSKHIDKKINKQAAIDLAVAEIKASEMTLETTPNPEVVIADGKYVYEVELVYFTDKPGRTFFYINTENGKVENRIDVNEFGRKVKFNEGNTTVGTGTDVGGTTRTFNTNYVNGSYYMVDLTRGNGIFTYDAQSRTRLPGNYWVDYDNVFNTSYDAPAVSAQYYLGVTYDYYMNKFNRNSFDDNGAKIIASVHVGSNYNNAYWNGSQFAFGDGDGSYFIPLSGALDVSAHEFTHAVTENTAGLVYQYESGALNEAISDIMGAAVEFYLNEDPDWLLGEDIAGPGLGMPALRSLEDPTAMGDPDHYSDRYTGSQDNGGVHTNSGIINKVAYLIGAGGTHYGYHVDGQGVEAMEEIFYRALTTYMTSTTDFADARLACVQAATDLYGSGSAEVQTVQDAFSACGIY